MAIQTLTTEQVLMVHEHVCKEFANTSDPVFPPGLKDIGLLESAVSRQHTSIGDIHKYSNVCSNASALMYGICMNHPFHNGNKRTALLSCILHLDRNGYLLDGVDRNQLYELMLCIAAHQLYNFGKKKQLAVLKTSDDDELRDISRVLSRWARPAKRGERIITYGQLYRIIEKFGFILGSKEHNKINILSEKKKMFSGKQKLVRVGTVSSPGDGLTVGVNEIKNVRKILKLTEDDGVDSDSFYDTRTVIDSFVLLNRNTLRKLAKV